MCLNKTMGLILKNISTLLTLAGAARKEGRHIQTDDLSVAHKQALVSVNGKIDWIGPTNKIPKEFAQKKSLKEHDMKGRTVLPGFVESHTHLIFAGDRAAEFEMRNQGISYQEIAARGGGILSTMKQTRASSLAELVKSGQQRLDHFVRQGVTTVEVKSGYALNHLDEIKVLKAAQALTGARTVSTFLGAHSLPPEFKTYEDYLDFLRLEVLPVVKKKKLARRVDIFIEKGFFPAEAGKKYLLAAKELGFDVIVHADQLSLSGGSQVAIDVGALSADHLLQVTDKEIKNLGRSSVTCVLLPASDLYMKTKYPAAQELIAAGARVALATDFNPGSSPTQDLNLVGLLARLEMKMSLPQVLSAYTVGAAWALGLSQEIGSLELGKSADFVSTQQDWQTLFYSVGQPIAEQVFLKGKRVF